MLVDFSNMFRNSVAVNIVTFPAMDSIVFSSMWSLSYFSRSNGNSIRILDFLLRLEAAVEEEEEEEVEEEDDEEEEEEEDSMLLPGATRILQPYASAGS